MASAEQTEAELNTVPNGEARWELIQRVAHSAQLRRAPRLQELLLFIGKRSLKDGCDRLQEHEIGASVFHRPDSYDTSLDNIVRTSVSDLRRRIEAYFNAEGASETLFVEIPRGSYIPVFRSRELRAGIASTAQPQATEPNVELAGANFLPESGSRQTWRRTIQWMIAAIAIAALSGVSIYFWDQNRELSHSIYGSQQGPLVAGLWSRILNSNSATDIVMSDTGIGMVETLSHKQFSLNEYLTHSYVAQLDGANLSPEMRGAINRILAWNLANPDEFTLARRILALDPAGKSFHLFNARNYMPDLVRRDNVVLIGARKSNPWDELYDSQLNFITAFDSPQVINHHPIAGEMPVYLNTDSVGYCVVALMPKPDQSGVVLLIEGTNAEATEAAGDFLLSEDQLSNIAKLAGLHSFPYFQVLLKVSSVRGTPLSATIEAYRTYPSTH
jgi:hypothetical protein